MSRIQATNSASLLSVRFCLAAATQGLTRLGNLAARGLSPRSTSCPVLCNASDNTTVSNGTKLVAAYHFAILPSIRRDRQIQPQLALSIHRPKLDGRCCCQVPLASVQQHLDRGNTASCSTETLLMDGRWISNQLRLKIVGGPGSPFKGLPGFRV